MPTANNSVSREEKMGMPNQDMRVPVPTQPYRLWHTIDQFDLDQFEFFGGFYEDRLKFYYTPETDVKIGGAKVQLIMLYFLDERLVKIRYHVDRNIEEYLTDSLGVGRLDSKYTRKKRVLATKKSLDKLRNFNLERNYTDEYGISWDRDIIFSSFNVNGYSTKRYSFDTIAARFVYIDQLKSFRRRLMEIENSRIVRARSDSLQSHLSF